MLFQAMLHQNCQSDGSLFSRPAEQTDVQRMGTTLYIGTNCMNLVADPSDEMWKPSVASHLLQELGMSAHVPFDFGN